MNKTTIFYAGIAVAVIALLVAVYYVIPGVYHVLASGNPNAAHYKHAAAFAAVAVVAALAAVINRPRSAASRY